MSTNAQHTPELSAILAQIEACRPADVDYLIVGARGPNTDMNDGNAFAEVRMGDDQATAEAKYLGDAVSLARAKIIRAREARENERKKNKATGEPK